MAEDARAGGGYRWVLVATVLLAVAAGLGFLRTWPPLATVMSASMAPTINTGDIVVLKRLDAPATVGQVVMVRVPDEARSRYGYPPVVIHRVAKIAPDGAVTTKGDAKKETDPFTVPRTAINTRVLTHIPAIGQVFGFLRSTLGLLWLAGGALMFVGLPLLERHRGAQRREDEQRDEREHVLAELRVQVELLPTQIERAVANAVAAIEPPAPAQAVVAAPAPVAPTQTVVPAPAALAPAAPVAPAAVRSGVFAVPAIAAPAPRIVAAAKLAAVAATRLTPPPAPLAPDTPPTRRRFSAAPFVPMVDLKPVAVPAPPTPATPTQRLGFVPAFEPSIGVSFFAMPAPAAPPAPAPRLTAASAFTPQLLTRPVLAPPPAAPPARLAAASTFTPALTVTPASVPAPPAPATPAPRLLAASTFTSALIPVPAPPAPEAPAPSGRFSRLVPATQRT